MANHILFFHGGGERTDYEADAKLVESLRTNLGTTFVIQYPFLENDGSPDLGRRKQISQLIAASSDKVILVAHSLGASMLLACLTEMKIEKKISGIFLISTPFWKGHEDWVKPFKLNGNFEKALDRDIPLHFYHAHDDEEVPFEQFNIYRNKIPWATFHEIKNGGHQLNNDLSLVSNHIKSL